jgi:hypothetical protein
MTSLFARTVDECIRHRTVVESLPTRTTTDPITASTTDPQPIVVRPRIEQIAAFTKPEVIYVSP